MKKLYKTRILNSDVEITQVILSYEINNMNSLPQQMSMDFTEEEQCNLNSEYDHSVINSLLRSFKQLE